MKSFCCLLFVVFLMKTTVADKCGHAEARLMGCFLQVNVNFERAGDPEYKPELCKGLGELVECGETAKKDCPLPPEITQTIDAIAQSSAILGCGTDENSACQNPMLDIQNCQQSLQTHASDGSDYCTMYGGFKTCLTDVQSRCGEALPGMAQSGLSEMVTNINAALESLNCDKKKK